MSNWITYSPITGHGNSTVTLTAQTLSELEDRVATMVGYNVSYAISASTEITQKAEPPTAITFDGLSVVWISDIPASGGTATKDNCSYKVYAKYSDGSQVDVTNLSEVTGSLNVPATTAETRQSAGQLTLIAAFDGESASTSVDVYQVGNSVSRISIGGSLAIEVPGTGGTANSANCSFVAWCIYSNGDEYPIYDGVTYTGSLFVPATTATTRQYVGDLIITGEYNGFTAATKPIKVYQMPSGVVMTGLSFDNMYYAFTLEDDGIYYVEGSFAPYTGQFVNYKNLDYRLKVLWSDGSNTLIDNSYWGMNTFASFQSNSLSLPQTNEPSRRYKGDIFTTVTINGFSATSSAPVFQNGLHSYEYLTFEIVSGGTLTITSQVRNEYQIDGVNWNTISVGTTNINVNAGDVIRFRCESDYNATPNTKFRGTAYFNVYGLLETLRDKHLHDAEVGIINDEDWDVFRDVFKSSNVISAAGLQLSNLGCSVRTYYETFANCSHLEEAPYIPLLKISYWGLGQNFVNMFKNCTNLNKIECLLLNPTEDSFSGWTNGVSATGTFVKHPNATWTTGTSGIPTGWTVIDVA